MPHSEIHGSRPVHGSPWLIAVYHVLHRLLLPRHPPNALFALDLIRKEQGRRFIPTCTGPFASPAFHSDQKLVHFPPAGKPAGWSVYQTWIASCLATPPKKRSRYALTRAYRHEADVYLSQRCQCHRAGWPGSGVRQDDPARQAPGSMILSRIGTDRTVCPTIREGSWWSLPGSNR